MLEAVLVVYSVCVVRLGKRESYKYIRWTLTHIYMYIYIYIYIYIIIIIIILHGKQSNNTWWTW